jgi:hypothetical protein
MLDYLYYLLGYSDEEITPDPKVIKHRHLLLKQIRLSQIRLRPNTTNRPSYKDVLTNYKKLVE